MSHMKVFFQPFLHLILMFPKGVFLSVIENIYLNVLLENPWDHC